MEQRLRGKPKTTTLIQAYAPTADSEEEEIEQFYAEVGEAITRAPRGDVLYILGDFNAKIGAGMVTDIVGKYGLGERNEAGNRLIQFCQEHRMRVTNTWFEQPRRRLYTWTSPGGQYRNQIDYILCQQRWKSSVHAVKTFPGADCGTDHELLGAKIKVKFCRVKRPPVVKKCDIDKIGSTYATEVTKCFETLALDELQETEVMWERIKEIVVQCAEQYIPYRSHTRRTMWIKKETVAIAEERRIAKMSGNRDKTKLLNAAFQRAARKDKEEFWSEECAKAQEAYRKGNTRELYHHARKNRTVFMARQANVRGNNGEVIHSQDGIRKRWKAHTEQLYAGNNYSDDEHYGGEETLELEMELEPDIMEEEVIWAMKQLASGKSPGIDNITLELLHPLPTNVLTSLCQRIWKSCEWPKEWRRSVFVPIPKKGDTMNCANYRTIALIPHASKVLLKIIQHRLSSIIERELPDEQAGFRKGRGTRDHIANLRWIMEKAREHQKKLYICFIDYSRAFDSIDHAKLWKCLDEMGAPAHLCKLIRSLYTDQEATVRTPYGDTDWFKIKKGARQGCIVSPVIFNMYAEMIMRNASIDESNIGVKIAGRNINNLRYADDTTLMAESEKDLKRLIQVVKEESEKFGLYLNTKKTKIMTTASTGKVMIKLGNEEIETVENFIFLGSKINSDNDCTPEIRRRIAMGREAMISMNKVWKSRDIKLSTKSRLVESIIFSIATYGCETWTIKKADRRRIDAFELWCWRRLLRIPWTARVTNRKVLEQINPKMTLEAKITKQRLSYFGHIMRSKSLEKDIMLGMLSGKRRRGRQRTRWLDTIKNDTGMTMAELKNTTQDRNLWRAVIHRVTEGRKRLNGT